MIDSFSTLLGQIAGEFTDRHQRGERPSVEEYAARYPEVATLLREVLPFVGLAGSAPPPQGRPDLPGYSVVRELGRGGMGVVYEALQASLGRRVAVKMLLHGGADDPAARVRFLAEAETAARLRHPNLVQVHELGQHEGRPFLVMEYVEGGSLAGALAGGPLPPPAAAALVRDLAAAAQHAHENGVVHRDLKPANVLLGVASPLRGGPPEPASERRDYTPKIADFGLARRLEAGPGLTATGAVVGTPSYMAPEQARGQKDIGPAADVYALGAILYECLTGRPPFRAATALETLQQVVETDPVPPRVVNPQAPRDLDTVALKCLQKSPGARYASAADLAADLGRFLAGEPVRARPVGPVERAAKWARKRPAVAGLLGALVVGLGLAFWAVKAEQLRTAKQRDLALKAEQEAKENLEQARQAVDECFGLARDDPTFQSDHLQGVRKLLLEKTLPFYEAFTRKDPDDEATAARQAGYLWRVGYIAGEIGSKAEAIRRLRESVALLTKLNDGPLQGEDGSKAELARCLNTLGYLQSQGGEPKEAQANLERARDILSGLSERHPGNSAYRAALGLTCTNLGILLWDTGQREEATKHHRQALAIREKLSRESPKAPGYQADLAQSLKNLGAHFSQMSRPKEARESYEKARDIWLGLSRANPRVAWYQSELATTYGNLAFLQAATGEPAEARENYRRALEIHTTLARSHPDVTRYQDLLANTWNNLGLLQHEHAKDTGEALKSYEQARTAFRALSQAHPEVAQYQTQLAGVLSNTAWVILGRGDAKGSLPHFDEAVRLLQAVRERQPNNVVARDYLVTTLWKRARARESVARYRDAADDNEAARRLDPGLLHPYLLRAQTSCLAKAGDFAQVKRLADEPLLTQDVGPPGMFDLATLFSRLAKHEAGCADRPLPEREKSAERWARRAMEMLDRAGRAGGFKNPRLLEALKTDSQLEFLRGRDDFKRWLAGVVQPGGASP